TVDRGVRRFFRRDPIHSPTHPLTHFALTPRQHHPSPAAEPASPGAVEGVQTVVPAAEEGAPGGVAGDGDAEGSGKLRFERAPVAVAGVLRIAPGGFRQLLERRIGEG